MGASYNDNINKMIFFHGCFFDSDRVAFLSQNWNNTTVLKYPPEIKKVLNGLIIFSEITV